MPKNYILSPSILSADFTRLGEQIAEVEKHGADWIHIDIMDGNFVPNLTMGPAITTACKTATSLPLDVHLMVKEPEKHIEAFANAGADILTIHTEASPNLYRTLQEIKALGCKAGVTTNPGTPADAIRPVLHLIDLVLVMTVNPGYSGQKFLPETVQKIAQTRALLDESGSQAVLEVDGGINAETLPLAIEAGAQAFVAASAIFKHPQGIAAGIQVFKNAFES